MTTVLRELDAGDEEWDNTGDKSIQVMFHLSAAANLLYPATLGENPPTRKDGGSIGAPFQCIFTVPTKNHLCYRASGRGAVSIGDSFTQDSVKFGRAPTPHGCRITLYYKVIKTTPLRVWSCSEPPRPNAPVIAAKPSLCTSDKRISC